MLVLVLLNISSKSTGLCLYPGAWYIVVFNNYSLNEERKELPFLLPGRNWVKQKD